MSVLSTEIKNTPLLTDANIKGYFRMENGALTTDSSGAGRTLTNTNSVINGGETIFGLGNDCADFGTTNTNKGLYRADDMGLGTGAFTFSMWVKMRTEISSGEQFFLHYGASGGVRGGILYQYNGGTRRLNFIRTKEAVADQSALYNITLGTANVYHIGFVFNGSTLYGYVNGANVTNGAASGTGSAFVNTFTIGSAYNGGYAPAPIYAEDVVIFNRALSDAEMLKIYNGNWFTATTNQLVKYRRTRTAGSVSGV